MMKMKLYVYLTNMNMIYGDVMDMGILKNKLPWCAFYLFLLPIISASNCSFSTCGSLVIRFPFHLNQTPLACGSPGFNLTCKSPHNQTAITLPGSGDFLVRQISYLTQTLLLYDPANCLPRRLQGFNLSGSPLLPDFSANYTLFSCPRQFRSSFPSISCLSNTTTSVFAILTDSVAAPTLSGRCHQMDTLMLPAANSTPVFLTGDTHLKLKWESPQVNSCIHPGGSREAAAGLEVFKIIALSIAIPAMICAIGVGVFLCLLDDSISQSRGQQSAVNPQPAPASEGLDQATIDTYAKVVLGESKRVPGPNDDTCPICLSEFSPNETLRSIPECQHCFHTDCIDEWLRIRGTCPLCRKLPSQEGREGRRRKRIGYLPTSDA